MYPISNAFLTAVKANTRKYYWTGRITTKDGAVYEFDQDDMVKGSGSISYKAVPKQAPNISVSGLALLQIRLHLKKFNALRLQKAGYFTNYFLEEEYFKFDKWKYGPVNNIYKPNFYR